MEDVLQCDADVHGHLAQIGPVAAVRNRKAVIVGFLLRRDVLTEVRYGLGVVEILCVRHPLQEQEREDVALEVGRVYGAPEAVRGRPETTLQLCESEAFGYPVW